MRIKGVQKLLDKLRGKKKFVLVNCGKGNKIDYHESDLHFLNIKVHGNNNKIEIKKLSTDSGGKIFLDIYGDDNVVCIDENFCVAVSLVVTLGSPSPLYGKVRNVECLIGKNVRMEEVGITTYNSCHKIAIGSNCLFSLKVNLFNTDGHPIYNAAGKLVNFVPDMIIGENCWIGYNSVLLKGCVLPEGTIVGWGSVVSGKSFTRPHCAIGGNPAKVLKENVFWSKGPDSMWIDNCPCLKEI